VPGIVSAMTLRHLAPLLIALVVLAGCTSADDYRQQADQALAVGDVEQAQDTLQKALESHPDDLELLLTAGELYLRAEPQEHYKPRLALHYAMRADRAADHQDQRAARLLARAYRAAGGTQLGDAIVQRGLEQVGHHDALAPKRLSAADPDLLEPTAANLREQARRDAARKTGETPCPDGHTHVPGGTYPANGIDLTVSAYCVAAASVAGCPGGRACTDPETRVACTALGAVLGDAPACADPGAVRCCADASIAGPPADQ